MRGVLATLLVAAFACGDSGIDPAALPVDQRGPFNVGVKVWDVTYQPEGLGQDRTIKVHVWYPTEDVDGNNPAYLNIFRDDDVFEDAAPAAPVHAGGYPVLAHSHGHRGYAGNSSDIFSYVVSHGWVVVAPDHTGNLVFDDAPRPTWLYYARSMDVSRSIDELATLELAGPIAHDRVVLSGHSFGAYTVWASAGAEFDEPTMRAACDTGGELADDCTDADLAVFLGGLHDSRVVAAIPMAGGDRGWFGGPGYDAVDVPVMLMTGGDDDVGAAALVDLISDVDLTWLDIEGGCHQLFGLGGCDLISDEEGFPIVNTFALAFARRWLLDDDAADVAGVLDGSLEVSPRVTLTRR